MPSDLNRYRATLLLVGLFCFSPLFLMRPDSNMVMAQTPDARKAEGDRLSHQGSEQYQTNQYELAIQSWGKALVMYRTVRDRNREAKTLYNLGIAYSSLSQYDKSIAYFQQALPLFQQLKDHSGEAYTLNDLGIAHRALSQYEKAIEDYQQALTIFQQVKDRNGEASTLSNLGIVYNSLSQYEKAMTLSQQALTIFQQVKDRNGEASTLSNLGIVYNSLSQYDKAIAAYQQALPIFQQIKDRNGEALVLAGLGTTYDSLSQYGKTIIVSQQALLIFQKIKNRDGEVGALNSLANAYLSLSQYDKAITSYQQAWSIVQQSKDLNGAGAMLINLGNIYGLRSHYKDAVAFYYLALLNFRTTGNHAGEARSLNNLGAAWFSDGNSREAEKPLLEAAEIWESLRPGLTDEQRRSLFETQIKTYDTLQEVQIALHKFESALETSERGRARAFVELLAARLAGETSATAILQQRVEKPTIKQIQRIAKTQDSTLVQYSIVSDKILYIWVIKPNGKVAFRQINLKSLPSSLESLVASTREVLGARSRATLIVKLPEGSQKQATERQKQRSRQLHKLLIDPIADLLPKNPNDRVIFIPQGSLFLVPFPALQNANGKYLIEKHTILTAPSIQVLDQTHQLQQQRQSNPAVETLVVGNPLMPIVTPYPGEPPQRLNALPGAEAEANVIAPLLKTQALTGTQGTKAAIKQKMPNARIIHLATHGLLDDLRGLGSAIALAPDHPGTPNDGLLTAEEILNLKLSADLVVLSACDTGRGRITGDGVIGLSRSFISAGVPSIIVSLWAVPDAPTAELMTKFYTNWQVTKLDKAQALRQAMLTTMKTHPNPRDWAAFTLIGEAE